MRNFQVGDIIVCHRKIPNKGNVTYNLIVGHKYIIRTLRTSHWSSLEMFIEIEHLVSGKNMGLYSMNFFIPLSQYREEQIDKILNT